jgi:hypothetical protein
VLFSVSPTSNPVDGRNRTRERVNLRGLPAVDLHEHHGETGHEVVEVGDRLTIWRPFRQALFPDLDNAVRQLGELLVEEPGLSEVGRSWQMVDQVQQVPPPTGPPQRPDIDPAEGKISLDCISIPLE